MNHLIWDMATDLWELEDVLNKATDRQKRLFSCACVRLIWDSITERVCREAVEISEKFADGAASAKDLAQVAEAAMEIAWPHPREFAPYTANYVASQVADQKGVEHPGWIAGMVWEAVPEISEMKKEIGKAQCRIVRDLLGNPFRQIKIDPIWQSPMVMEIAEAIYLRQSFHEMQNLAQEIEKAGCCDTEIINHVKKQQHFRGCWLIDLLLNKETSKILSIEDENER